MQLTTKITSPAVLQLRAWFISLGALALQVVLILLVLIYLLGLSLLVELFKLLSSIGTHLTGRQLVALTYLDRLTMLSPSPTSGLASDKTPAPLSSNVGS